MSVVLAEKTVRLSFGINVLDELFSGFEQGDLAVLHGDCVASMLFTLAVRCQLPACDGGFDSPVIFVDGWNSFRLYEVSEIAQMFELDPAKVLQRIFISRAFTAYQMTSIIMEKLEETVEKHGARLVLISNLAELYLDKDVPTEEARTVFFHVVSSLAELAKKCRAAIIATHPSHHYLRKDSFFHATMCGKADVVVSVKKTWHSQDNNFILEKHPSLCLGRAVFPCHEFTIDQFV